VGRAAEARRDPAHAGRGPAGHRDRAARGGQDRGEPGRGARGRRGLRRRQLLLRLDRLRDEALLPHTSRRRCGCRTSTPAAASTCWSTSCATGTCCSSWTRASTCSARAPRWSRRCCRPAPRCRSWRPAGNRCGCRARRPWRSARCGWRTRSSCWAGARRRRGCRSRRRAGPPWPRSACSWTSCRWPSSWQRPKLARLGRDRPSRPPAEALAELLTRLEAGQAGPDGNPCGGRELRRARTAPDAAGRDRLKPRAVHPVRALAVGPALGVHRPVRPGGRDGRVRG